MRKGVNKKRLEGTPDSFGIQNIFKEFPTNNFVTENGKELYCPKGGRVRDRKAVSTWEPRSGS
jgi:hypothetical protein